MSRLFSNEFRASIRYRWDLLCELVRRDLKAQYEGTMLGFAWTLILPFLHLGIYYFLFKVILQIDVTRFTTFAFIGIIAYGWFQSAISGAAGSTIGNRDLILRPQFPAPVMPLVAISSTMLNFIFTLPLLLLLIFIEKDHISIAILLMPIVMGIQFLLSLGIGYMTAILNIIFRDSKHIIDTLLRLFYFLSPVFYNPDMVPEQYQWLYNMNPLVTILRSYRDTIMYGRMPQWSALGIVAVFSIGTACLGYYIFQKQSYRFLEEL